MIVTIFYNEIDDTGSPVVIHPNCPTLNLPLDRADKFAKERVESGEWLRYIIPELTEKEVLYEL